MGNPFEWLRSMARGRGEHDDLALEAARGLGSLADEPAGLVVACRRLLAHHPSDGPLWWVAAHILAAPDARAAATRCADLLSADRTATRLAGALPLQTAGELLAVAGWTEALGRALDERPDLDVVATVSDDSPALQRRIAKRAEIVEPYELAEQPPVLLLAAACAFDHLRVVVDASTNDALAEIPPSTTVWVVGGVGRALPPRMLDALIAATRDVESVGVASLERFDRVVDGHGAQPTIDAAGRADCPIASELLRPLGG